MLKRFSSLRARLLLLVALASLPVFLMILYAGIEQRRAVADGARGSVLSIARFAAANHRQLLGQARGIVSTVADLPLARQPESPLCAILLGKLVAHNDRFANLGIITADGNLRCSGTNVPLPIYMGDRPYVRAALDHARRSAHYEVDMIVAGPTLIIATPSASSDPRKRNIVYAAVRLDWFDRLLTDAGMPPHASVSVLSAKQRILAQYPTGGSSANSVTPQDVASVMGRSDEGALEAVGADGVERLYAYARLADSPTETVNDSPYIFVAIPMRDVYLRANTVLMRSIMVFFIAMATALVLAWFGSDALVLRRLRTLLGATRQIAGGDLRVRTRLTGAPAELVELSTTLDDMTRSLERREREEQRHLARISRQNRVHRVLSGISSAVLRIRDRDELLREACHIAVADGKFLLAWIGLVEADHMTIAAAEGERHAPPPGLVVSLSSVKPSPPYVVAAIEGRAVVLNEPADGRVCPDPHCAIDYGSVVLLPLRIEDRVVGIFALYAAERGFFDDEELHVLDALAADTGFGLGYIEQTGRLSYLANYDPTTGLPNRNLFQDRLGQLVMQRPTGRPAAVAVLSLVNARRVSDVLGRAVLDRVVVALARRLSEAINRADTASYLGPAEFGLIISDVDGRDDAGVRVHALLERLPEFIDIDGEPVVLRLHAGVATFPDDADRADALLHNAELALHDVDAKAGHKLRLYSPQANVQARERLALERELHFAAERGELALCYQPIVDLRSDRVIGVEALLRWHHPLLGLVSPDRFVPIAEKTGLILSIGEWVLEAACTQAASWHASGYRIRVAANVSVHQLRQRDLETRLHGTITRAGLDPRTIPLGLELTETDVMENMDQAEGTLRRLRDLGLFVHIDDFGTGHSSLAYLRRLPIDTLKIDRSFVTDLAATAEAREVVRAIIVLAHNLRLRVIAEGVETERQLAILRDLECDAVQGFLLGRPQTAEAIEPMFEGYRAPGRTQGEARP